MQTVIHLFYRKVTGILHYIKPKVLPPNVVSIFLFLLTNGAANQTGKSEKGVEKNYFPLNHFFSPPYPIHIIYKHIKSLLATGVEVIHNIMLCAYNA